MNDEYRFKFYKPNKKYFFKKEINNLLINLKGFEFTIENADEIEIMEKQTDVKSLEITHLNPFGERTFYNLFLTIDEDDPEIALLTTYQETINLTPDGHENQDKYIIENQEIFYKAACAVAYALEPYFAWGGSEYGLNELEEYLSFDKVGALSWINLFSHDFIEKLGGPEKILLFPNPKAIEEYEKARKTGKYMFIPISLDKYISSGPSKEITKKCQEKFPGIHISEFSDF